MSTHVTCPDSDALVSFLYDEFEPGGGHTRQDVAHHVNQCARCTNEIAMLGGVREQLAAWTTPEVDLGFRVIQEAPARPLRGLKAWTAWAFPTPAWRALPATAAAVLVLGGAIGLARLDIQYDSNGLRVRSGWGQAPAAGQGLSPTRPVQSAESAQPVPGASPSTAVAAPLTAADLAAFERRLRRELASSVAATSVVADPAPSPRVSDAALVKLVRQLVEESEVRQQQNLQLRVNELSRDFQMRRQADLVSIEQSFGRLQGDTAQQRQMLNQYLRNVSTGARPPQ